MITDILTEARKRGFEINNYCSDLYLYVGSDTLELIEDYEYQSNVTTFVSETDRRLMFDIPFAYTDYYKI